MRTADVAKLVSLSWKALTSDERHVFLELAKKDKERYEIEKASYNGPWKVKVEENESSNHSSPVSTGFTDNAETNALTHGGFSNSGVPTSMLWDRFTEPVQFNEPEATVLPSLAEHASYASEDISGILASFSAVPGKDQVSHTLCNPGEERYAMNQTTKQAKLLPWKQYMNETRGIKLSGNLGDGPYLLEPLIPTDTGSYLAAAAMYANMFDTNLEW
jgi:hypothetical protein